MLIAVGLAALSVSLSKKISWKISKITLSVALWGSSLLPVSGDDIAGQLAVDVGQAAIAVGLAVEQTG
jgi:hypothetical protein